MRQKLSQKQVVACKIIGEGKSKHTPLPNVADLDVCLNCTKETCKGDCSEARKARRKQLDKKAWVKRTKSNREKNG